ncbi:MAG: hypothetical protein CML66_07190 [Rhodobacteraceae bacterium]|nr:hypothetical protein [Paracoccaceae bacterium]
MDDVRRNWTRAARRESVAAGPSPIPVVIADPAQDPVGTVLVIHGRNGAPDQPQIAEIANAYLARGWRVAAPELPHSAALPASGPPDRLSIDGHWRIAGQVLTWTRGTFPGTVAIAGHSIGGFATAMLSCDPSLHHLLAVSPVLTGQRLLAARRAMGPQAMAELERDAPQYRAELDVADATATLKSATPPAAVVTGAEDGIVTLDHARAWFDAAPNARFFGSLPGQHHCPDGPDCAAMLAAALMAVGA